MTLENNPFEIKNKDVWNTLKRFTSKRSRITKAFLKGTQKGQIRTLYREREYNPQKIEEYKSLLESREIVIDESILSPQGRNRLKEMGITIDDYKD